MKYFLYTIFTISVLFLTSCAGINRALTSEICYIGNTSVDAGGTRLAEVKGADDDSEETVEVTTYNYDYPTRIFPYPTDERKVEAENNDPSLKAFIPKETGIPASYQVYIETRSTLNFQDWSEGSVWLTKDGVYQEASVQKAKRVSYSIDPGMLENYYLEETILEVPLDILNSWRYPIQPNGVNIRLRSLKNKYVQDVHISSAEIKVFLDKVKEVSKI